MRRGCRVLYGCFKVRVLPHFKWSYKAQNYGCLCLTRQVKISGKNCHITFIEMRQLVYNAVTCTECKELLVSYRRHDYKTCSCPNEAMVDGGLDYLRYGAKDMDKVKSIALYADDDFIEVRCYATRGSRGKDGKQPLTWIPLKDMEDDHLQAVLDYGGAGWHLYLIRKEIKYREYERSSKV